MNVVSQGFKLDVGTYKIINRASQTSLCSYRMGGAIYVSSTRDYLGPHELWELHPGAEDGLYIIRNIGLDSYVRANEKSGASVVTSNGGTTSFVVSSTGGNGYIIKFLNNDLVWTLDLSAIAHGGILLLPANGGDTQLWTLIPTENITTHKGFTKFGVQTRDLQEEEERNLVALRGIEKLGGSAGYQTYLESPGRLSNLTRIVNLSNDGFSNNIAATASVFTALIYTTISVQAGGYSGSGSAWGVGVADISIAGTLYYNSWDDLLASDNTFSIAATTIKGIDGTAALFSVGGNDVAALVASGGAGFGALIGIDGTFQWKANS
jgi:hypothetical protein